MTQDTKSPWGNGDDLAAKAAEEVTLEPGEDDRASEGQTGTRRSRRHDG